MRRASCGALAVWLLAGCAGGQGQVSKPASAPAARTAEVSDVRVSGTGDAVKITVTTTTQTTYSLVKQATPPRLFLEFAGTTMAGDLKEIPVNRGAVSMVKPSAAGTKGSIEVFLSAAATYDIEGRGTRVVLTVSPRAATAAPETESGAAAAGEGRAAAEPTPEPAPAAPAAVITTAKEEPAPAAPAAEVPAVVPAGPRELTAIDVQKQPDGLVVVLQGNGPLLHEYFLVEGKSLVVDIADTSNKVWPMKKKVDDAWVTQIRIGQHEQPKKIARVVFDLKKVGEYRVEGVGDRIVVAFGAPALAATAAAVPPSEGAVSAVNTVGEVTCRPVGSATRLEIRTAVKADFTIVDSGDPAKVVIEIANARIPEKNSKTLDLASQGLGVVKVSSFPFTKDGAQLVRVVAQLRQPVPFRAVAEGTRVLVDFDAPPPPAPVAAAEAPAAGEPAAATTAPAPGGEPLPDTSAFTGRRLSLDFKDADVNDILRLISEVSGLNFVAGPEVKGTVTIKLADVPWDLALNIILKTNVPQLDQIRESDNIIRITTADKILDEEQRRRRFEEDRKKTSDAQKALEPVFSKSFQISYVENADLESFVGKIEKFKSSQGIVQFDKRTKNIIVWDTAEKLKEIEAVLVAWDAPTPAVMVEARIVEVSSAFEQSLGVQWNMAGVKDAAHGNATDYAFPNSMSVGGTQTGADGGTYMVNLPTSSATAGVGFSFGHIANTLSLDLRLSAMETLGQTKILSNPKVLVVHNQKAVINVGSQLPVTKTSTEGERTVEWKDVGIMLEVTPTVTNDNRIFLDVKVEKSSQGDNVETTDGTMFSINTSRAQTKVLIADGETTVIGGIFVQSSSGNESSVPGLSKLPLFGWLFKSKADKQNKQELMIFITPRRVTM